MNRRERRTAARAMVKRSTLKQMGVRANGAALREARKGFGAGLEGAMSEASGVSDIVAKSEDGSVVQHRSGLVVPARGLLVPKV